ncbi:MAG: YlxM family DNA-binding protein [Clostridia bacterium]
MEKNLRYSALLSVYGGLLTEKQFDTMEYYYDEDLSLGEIAENTGISRQGVRDFIKRGEESLDAFEEKLGLYKKMGLASEIEKAAEKIKEINRGAWSNRNIENLADEIIGYVNVFRNDI